MGSGANDQDKNSAKVVPVTVPGSCWAKVCVVFILLLAFGLRVYRLGYQSMWWDEMHAGMMAVIPIRAMLGNLFAIRNHVPLYFVLMRFWALLGQTEFTLRFFSVIWGLVSVVLIYRLGDLVGGRWVGVIAALLLALSPFHVWYSQEARMYTLVSASTLAAGWFLMRLLQRDSWIDLVGYGLCMAVALYTHYLALFVLLAHYVFFSLSFRYVKRLFLRWLVCSGGVLFLFGIWAAMMLLSGGFAGSPIGWIAPAHWYEPILTLLTFVAGPTIGAAWALGYLSLGVCLAVVGVFLYKVLRQKLPLYVPSSALSNPAARRRIGETLVPRLLVYWVVVPLSLTWVISLDLPIAQKRSIYVDRYLINSLPAFIVLVAWGVRSIFKTKRWIAFAVLVIVIAPVVPALLNLYFDSTYERDDWRTAMSYVEKEWQAGDVLLLRPGHTLPMVYYIDTPVTYQEFPFLFQEDERKAYLANTMESRMSEIAQTWDRAWLVSSVDNINPHGYPHDRNATMRRVGEEDAIKAWLDMRYVSLEQTPLTGVWITLYDLSQARDG